MYYELYIDVFLLVNIWIDLIVLLITKKVIKLSGGILRRATSAVVGSVLLCIYILTDLWYIRFGYFLFMFLTGCIMIAIAFKFNSVVSFSRAAIVFFVVALCLNGVFNQLIVYINNFYQIIAGSILIYLIFSGAQKVLNIYRNDKKIICEVRLVFDGNEILTHGLWDTGNCLISPYHNKGVSIIEYRLCEPYINNVLKNKIKIYMGESFENAEYESENDEQEISVGSGNIFAVPYKTINSSNGIMPVIVAERMTIKKEGELYEYNRPLIGITNNSLSIKGDYSMILTTKN